MQVFEKDEMVEENDNFEYFKNSTSESNVNLENKYYQAKTIKEKSLEAALADFQSVLDQQDESTEEIWRFKTLKQMVKINIKLKNYEEAMKAYKQLLACINPALTTNKAATSVNSILDYISTSEDMQLLQDVYRATFALKNLNNDRLWFRINAALGDIFLRKKDFDMLFAVIEEMKEACGCYDPESDDMLKGTQLIEIYAFEMEMYIMLNNYYYPKVIFKRALKLSSSIPDTISMNIIRECRGRIYLHSGDFDKAYDEFFTAFSNFNNWTSARQCNCLKYLLLSSMVSTRNPLYFKQVKPYINNPEIKTIIDLIASYQNQSIREFEKILYEKKKSALSDQLLIEELISILPNLHTKKLLLLVKRFNSVKIWFIAEELGITENETKNLIVSGIQNKEICGVIDQQNNILILDHSPTNL